MHITYKYFNSWQSLSTCSSMAAEPVLASIETSRRLETKSWLRQHLLVFKDVFLTWLNEELQVNVWNTRSNFNYVLPSQRRWKTYDNVTYFQHPGPRNMVWQTVVSYKQTTYLAPSFTRILTIHQKLKIIYLIITIIF